MIEIVHTWKPTWSYFTLASLIDKDEDYRLHLYVHEEDYNDLPLTWIFENIPNVRVYESYWKKDFAARAIQHLRIFWKDKGLHKRIMYAGGNRIFLKSGWENEIPGEDFFQNKIAHLSRKKVYVGHKIYSNYYGMLDFAKADMPANWDTDFFMLNWDLLKNATDTELFYPRGYYHDLDSRVLAARNEYFFTKLHQASHGVLPRYMNGKNDLLIQWDAMPSNEYLNYNVMLRKSWSIALPTRVLEEPYTKISTGQFMSSPWDLYEDLVEKIPVNFRDARINEVLNIKKTRQKSTASKLLKVGYRLGKL